MLTPEILRGKGPDNPVRVWVPGCTTGEEAYSIGILLRELFPGLDGRSLRLFATDIDEAAVQKGRRGSYPERIAEHLSPERLARFFVRTESGYNIDNEVREGCIFSVHDLLRDPPMSELDLVVCRGVLACFGPDVQARLVPLFHFALRPGGHLLLGAAGHLPASEQLFDLVNPPHGLFRRRDDAAPPFVFPIAREAQRSRLRAARRLDLVRTLDRLLADQVPAAALAAAEWEPILAAARDPIAVTLAAELRSTRQELRATVQDLRASNDRLQVVNEELTSTNEELHLANRELRRSKEQLQSGNAELQRLNLQVCQKAGELDRANRDLARSEDALKAADRRKDEFLAVLGHELRNPLVPIRNAIDMMKRRAGSRDADRAVEVAARQVEHMTRLIDDLLDLTRVTSGRVVLQEQPLDLRELVRAVAEDCQSGAAEAGVSLSTDLGGSPVRTAGDPVRLSQVLGNLVHNALKFTPRGGRIRLELSSPPGGDAIVRVRDSGVGMDADTLSRLFQPFTRTPQGLSHGGLGLGLWLSRRLVELHGGTLQAASDGPGRGAVLTVRLPLRAAQAAAPSSPAKSSPVPGRQEPTGPVPRRILLVEDNADVAEAMSALLEDLGHTVTVAHTGSDGIELAKRHLPEVVLCDLGLPDMTGHDVARALRADQVTASAHLVALSGFGQDDDRRRSEQAGFATHLIKPVRLDLLERVLAAEGR